MDQKLAAADEHIAQADENSCFFSAHALFIDADELYSASLGEHFPPPLPEYALVKIWVHGTTLVWMKLLLFLNY